MKNGTLFRAYKRNLAEGGGLFDMNNKENIVGDVAGLGAGIIDGIGGNTVGGSAAKGALSGLAIGSKFGPVGGGIGAGVGLLTGLVKGIGAEKKREQERMQMISLKERMDLSRSNAMVATNPELVTGIKDQQYFAKGGKMKSPLVQMYMNGGRATKLSAESVDISGRSHAAGGVNIPGMNAEVEDNETIKGDYVFSDKLGFAKLHRPLARAIGKIENKPGTVERINSLRLLKGKENNLMLMQEYKRSQLNGQL